MSMPGRLSIDWAGSGRVLINGTAPLGSQQRNDWVMDSLPASAALPFVELAMSRCLPISFRGARVLIESITVAGEA